MQIHELNNFSGTLGSGAYLAIDDGNDTGKISSQGLLAATEARIDNIIAGDAPSAAEVVDARLGADGVTYSSLGTGIRSQFTDVKSAFNSVIIHDDTTNFINKNKLKSGYVKYDGSIVQPYSGLVYTEKIPMEYGDTFYWNALAKDNYAFYSSDGIVLSCQSMDGSLTSPMNIPQNTAYGIFTVNTSNVYRAYICNANRTPADYENIATKAINAKHSSESDTATLANSIADGIVSKSKLDTTVKGIVDSVENWNELSMGWLNGNYNVTSAGTFGTNAVFTMSEPFKVSAGLKIVIKHKFGMGYNTPIIAFFVNENVATAGSGLSNQVVDMVFDGSTGDGDYEITATVPANANYAFITFQDKEKYAEVYPPYSYGEDADDIEVFLIFDSIPDAIQYARQFAEDVDRESYEDLSAIYAEDIGVLTTNDGTTNSENFQRHLDLYDNYSGRTYIFSKGDYQFSSGLQVNGNVTIKGYNASKLVYSGNGDFITVLRNRVRISDIYIVGNNIAGTTGIKIGTNSVYANAVLIDHVQVSRFDIGIDLHNTWIDTLLDVSCSNNITGLVSSYIANAINLISFNAEGNQNGIDLQYENAGITFDGLICEGNSSSYLKLDCNSGNSITLINPYFEATTSSDNIKYIESSGGESVTIVGGTYTYNKHMEFANTPNTLGVDTLLIDVV